MRVIVGNDSDIECHQIYPKVKLHIQFHTFTMYMHILPFSDDDIVLSMQWMKSMGPILMKYNDLTMTFIRQWKIIELKGERDGSIHPIIM